MYGLRTRHRLSELRPTAALPTANATSSAATSAGTRRARPTSVPACGNPALSPTRAAGTQWIAAEVARVVPSLSVKRFDSDKREDLSTLLTGEPGVVVGTTALLRHPPLPNVSLVGVTLLDAFLSLGDFRAEEEAYRLLLNLGELSPERRPLTLIQTFAPESPLLHAYLTGESDAFVSDLLERRERFLYPPFAALAKVQLSAREPGTAERAATWLAGALRTAGVAEDELLGPSAAPVARIKGQYSYQLFRAYRQGGFGGASGPCAELPGRGAAPHRHRPEGCVGVFGVVSGLFLSSETPPKARASSQSLGRAESTSSPLELYLAKTLSDTGKQSQS